MPFKSKLKDKVTFDKGYFVKFIIVLLIEIIIALYMDDKIIRPYIGDVLVMVLMYFFIKSFYAPPTKRLPYYLFVIACAIELSQLIDLLGYIGLGHNQLARIVFGSTFDVKDIVCYGIGMILLIIWEKMLRRNIAYL